MTEDDSIEVNDFVLVPVEKDNHGAIVKVVNIEYFAENDVPLPVTKTKHIIRKCTDEDFVSSIPKMPLTDYQWENAENRLGLVHANPVDFLDLLPQ